MSWKDDQGYGFISPDSGGPPVFVHVSAFTRPGTRPGSNDIVTYQLCANEKGLRAEQVIFAYETVSRLTSFNRKTCWLLAASGFLGFVFLYALIGKLPFAVVGVYIGSSILAFLAYAADKSAAKKNAWRTSESTLHVLALVGGWPGALVGQQVLRHKSKKVSFLTVFWATVIINCGLLFWFLTPAGAKLLQHILGTLNFYIQ